MGGGPCKRVGKALFAGAKRSATRPARPARPASSGGLAARLAASFRLIQPLDRPATRHMNAAAQRCCTGASTSGRGAAAAAAWAAPGHRPQRQGRRTAVPVSSAQSSEVRRLRCAALSLPASHDACCCSNSTPFPTLPPPLHAGAHRAGELPGRRLAAQGAAHPSWRQLPSQGALLPLRPLVRWLAGAV